MKSLVGCVLVLSAQLASALRFDPREVDYNLNQNQRAQSVLEYSGQWSNHQFHPSPDNWRFPFYSLFLDRFVNGDPSNDNANGTLFEHDILSNQYRHGGDLAGLVDTLDYIQGMGIKVGSPIWSTSPIQPYLTHLGTVHCRNALHKSAMESRWLFCRYLRSAFLGDG